MSKPKAPEAPDYAAAAAVQGEANLEAARSTQKMGLVNQYSPVGSMTYTPIGDDRYRSDITMTPAGQALFDREMRLSEATGQIGEDMLGRVAASYDRPFDTSSLPQVAAPTTAGMFQPSLSGVQGDYAARMNSIGRPQAPTTAGLQGYSGVNIGSLPGLSTANGSGLPNAGGVSNAGLQGVTLPGQGLPQRQDLSSSGLGQIGRPDLAGLQQVAAPNDAQRQKLAAALMARQETNMARDEDATRVRLANQGIAQNSEAYNREMERMAQTRTDARNQADVLAGDEMARQFQMEQSLRGQQFGEQTQLSDIDRATRAQQFGERSDISQYGLAARGQQFGEQQGVNAAEASLRGQQFGEQQSMSEADRALRSQMLAERLSLSDQQNAARGQAFGEQAQLSEMDRATRAQQFGEQQSLYDMGRTSEQDAINRIAQQNALETGMFGMGMDLRNQQVGEAAQMYGLQQQARDRALQEAAYLRGIPLSELNAMRTGSQPMMPNFSVNQSGANVQAAPYYQATADQYGAALDKYNAQAGMFGNIMGGLFGLGSAGLAASDIRLKTQIKRIGETIHGLALYAFRYIWGGPEQVGVMAQEVLAVRPDCVVEMPGGYLAVNYGRLYAND